MGPTDDTTMLPQLVVVVVADEEDVAVIVILSVVVTGVDSLLPSKLTATVESFENVVGMGWTARLVIAIRGFGGGCSRPAGDVSGLFMCPEFTICTAFAIEMGTAVLLSV